MVKKALLVLLLLSCVMVNSQYKEKETTTKYPQNYFQNPLEIPLILSGTFGELRTNHFHAGIDFKTQKKEGFKVSAIADGYVSRIKIQHWGYGKALYVTHPNGYTSVYAHLKKFSPKIEAYVKKQQYKKESYEIQLFPGAETLALSKGELIAYSGNTGGSSAPHLHFEIRDTKTEKIINPLLFGVPVKDTKKPIIQSAYVYNLENLNSSEELEPQEKLQFTVQENGDLLTNKVYTSGKIGFAIKTFDRQDAAMNKNGVYKVELFVNKQKFYEHKLETFSFAESKYINLLIDYRHHYFNKERIQKCFVVPNNKLSIYGNVTNNGIIPIDIGLTYNIEVVVSDVRGNKTKLKVPVVGKKDPSSGSSEVIASKLGGSHTKTAQLFKRAAFNTASKDNVSVAIPKYSFYKDVQFNFDYKNGIAKVHNGSVPMHKNFTLTFDISDYSEEEKKQLFIARVKKNGGLSYVNTKRKPLKLYTNTRKLGNYKLASDIQSPTITPKNFKNGQWLSNNKTLKVRIKDDLSGIKKYRATIDGKWILMEYEPKTGILTYDFSDRKFTEAKHTLKIVVSDQVNNTKSYIATFYRKK